MKRRRSKNNGIMDYCADCKQWAYVQLHHEPVAWSEGGNETIHLCPRCHRSRHSQRNDWARWGRIGGLRTAQNPANWQRNLKQYRQEGIQQ